MSQDVKMWICHLAAQPGGLVPVGEEALSYVSVSLGLYLFLSLSFHLSSLSACGFILDFSSSYVKIIFGFAFSLYVWLGVSQSAP